MLLIFERNVHSVNGCSHCITNVTVPVPPRNSILGKLQRRREVNIISLTTNQQQRKGRNC